MNIKNPALAGFFVFQMRSFSVLESQIIRLYHRRLILKRCHNR